jgi:5-oxoprolinase (ATP-hydrolysing) subunit A
MTQHKTRSIDLNCDLGEGGPYDADLMRLVSSANIACGGHAGDAETMAAAVALARQHGVAIGAHPGHADRENFGRHELPITLVEAAALVTDQVAALEAVAGEPPRHIKLHGGLYHQAGRDAALGEAIVRAIVARWPRAVLIAFAGSPLVAVARSRGLTVAEEAFIDRGYAADGSLVPRGQPAAMIDDPSQAAGRAVRMVCDGVVETINGTLLPITAETLCIHGDVPEAVVMLAATRAAVQAVGVRIAAR